MRRTARIYLFALCCGLLFTSCERDEIPISLAPQTLDTTSRSTQLLLGDDYTYRLYYNIELDSVVSSHKKRDWDLAFESAASGSRIKLNSSKYMNVYNTEETDFALVTEPGNDGPYYDEMGEFLEFTALSDAQSGKVYVIDRGIDSQGINYGLIKLKLLSFNDDEYTIAYQGFDGSEPVEMTVEREPGTNLTHFSFDDGQVSLEPFNGDWDLLFTQYTRFFDNYLGQDNIYYLVSGVLSNPNGVAVASPLEEGVDEVEELSEALSLTYSTAEEAIGWDWKEFDLNTGLYTVQPNLYVVRSLNGAYYRMQFTGFYAADGAKGAPVFESKMLQ